MISRRSTSGSFGNSVKERPPRNTLWRNNQQEQRPSHFCRDRTPPGVRSPEVLSFSTDREFQGSHRMDGTLRCAFLPHRQQMLGAPFKPYFGLSGIVALDFALPI